MYLELRWATRTAREVTGLIRSQPTTRRCIRLDIDAGPIPRPMIVGYDHIAWEGCAVLIHKLQNNKLGSRLNG